MRLVAQQVLSLSALLLAATAGLQAQESRPTEYQLKAAFLFNFAKFIDWPPEAFAEPVAPFVIGVWGENPFGKDLEQTVHNKAIGGHPFMVKAVASLGEAKKCHILFMSTSESQRFRQIFEGLRGTSVLTVGETERFIEDGGMINFVIQGQKIRFRINGELAKNAGLKVSSKLLSLGEHPGH